MPSSVSAIVPVYRTTSDTDAALIKDLLSEHGIPSTLAGSDRPVIGALIFPTEVRVGRHDAERATALIRSKVHDQRT